MPPLWLPPPLQQEREELLPADPRFFIWVDQYPPVRRHSGWAYQLHQQLISLPGHLSWHGPLHQQWADAPEFSLHLFTDVAYWQFAHVFQRRPKDKSQLQIPNRGQRQYHSFTGHNPSLLHEQLKLAGPARGLPGDHGDSKRSFFSFQHNLPPQSQTCGHEPCRASRNRPHQNLRSETARSRRLQTILLHRQNRRGYRDLFSQRPRWMGPTLPIPSGSAYKVQGSSVSQKSHYPILFLMHFFSPETEVVNHFWVRCCGRVAQSELHSASEKKHVIIVIQCLWLLGIIVFVLLVNLVIISNYSSFFKINKKKYILKALLLLSLISIICYYYSNMYSIIFTIVAANKQQYSSTIRIHKNSYYSMRYHPYLGTLITGTLWELEPKKHVFFPAWVLTGWSHVGTPINQTWWTMVPSKMNRVSNYCYQSFRPPKNS